MQEFRSNGRDTMALANGPSQMRRVTAAICTAHRALGRRGVDLPGAVAEPIAIIAAAGVGDGHADPLAPASY